MTPVRLEPVALQSRVKHSTTEPLRSLYMLITLKHTKKIGDKCVKKVFDEKHSFIELTYVVGAHWNCLNEAIPMCTNNIIMLLKLRKHILKYTFIKDHVH